MTTRKPAHLLLLLLLILAACEACASSSFRISNLAFSLKSNTLLFSFCEESKCDLVAYSINSKAFSRIVPTGDVYHFDSAGFGSTESQFVSILRYRNGEFTSYPQIALIDLNARTFRKLTTDPSHKYGANFSYDGKKVAYVQSHGQRTWANGAPRANNWDIHVLDIASGTESKVTNFCFYSVSKPFFAEDNVDLIFSGEGPKCNYPTFGQPPGGKGYEQYRKSFEEDNIVRIGPSRMALEPWFKTTVRNSSTPQIARNGDVLFISRTNQLDEIKKGYYNYDLFLKHGDIIRRLTRLNTAIDGAALSPNSRYAAYLSDPERNRIRTLWIMNVETSEHEQISLSPLLAHTEKVAVQLISEEK